jgi:hypothetical protein
MERLGDIARRVLAGLAVARQGKEAGAEAPASGPMPGKEGCRDDSPDDMEGKIGGAPRLALVPVAVVRTAGGGQPPLPHGKGKAGAVESASRCSRRVQP